MPNIPILTYITRYWLLLLVTAGFIALCLNESIFQHLGALIYVPTVALVAQLSYLLVVHLFFRDTIDKDTHDGTYLKEWRALDPRTRIILTVVLRVGFFIGICIVAASVGK